jgi:hypothetical protein
MLSHDESESWNHRIDAVSRSAEAFDLVKKKYFDPFADRLGLRGSDEISQRCIEGGLEVLVGIDFPVGYAARCSITDVQATQHEMGHFVTVSERRCVMPAFGFGGGVPELGFQPWQRIHTRPASGVVEAKAIAWEAIMFRDLHGIDPPSRVMVDSLRYASDFHLYPGGGDEAKLEHVAALVDRFIARFEDISHFDIQWNERCGRLPELMARETIRRNLHALPPVYVERHEGITEGWDVTIECRSSHGVEETLVIVDDGEDATSEAFPTLAAARAWMEEIRTCYAGEAPEVAVSAPAPRM